MQKGHQFRTDGDGETICHLYEEYDGDAAKHLRGQFAFALWDSKQRKLIIARDRTGQKPLYYYHDGEVFVFGSEIKAILQHPAVPVESAFDDPYIVSLYLSYGYVPAPLTAFKGIHALLPGHTLTIDASKKIQQGTYWQAPQIASAKSPDLNAYVDTVSELLSEAVKLRLIADVPLGAFLSGGLDSSLIVALMKKHTNATIKTFSIGFEGDDSFDETPYAQEVADFLGTDHTAFRVKPDALDLLEKLVWHHDQPFADSSAIPTFLVSQLTRQHVTVALTGDGGDELFAGYDRFYAASLLQKLSVVPRPLWKIAAHLLSQLPEGTGYYNKIKRAGRFARGASQPLALAYFDWVRLFNADWVHDLTGESDHAGEHFQGVFADSIANDYIAKILYTNMTTYLRDDLLIKADRCSMAASLEARAPFLDHKLIEYVAGIPFNLKLNGRTTKYILKEAAKNYLPEHIIHRKKHGFGVPLGAWLRDDIQPVRDILLSQNAKARSILNQSAVEQLITEHSSRQRDHGFRLWTLLTLEMWHRLHIDGKIAVKSGEVL